MVRTHGSARSPSMASHWIARTCGTRRSWPAGNCISRCRPSRTGPGARAPRHGPWRRAHRLGDRRLHGRRGETCQNVRSLFRVGLADAARHMKVREIMRWRIAGLLLAMLIIVGLPYIVTLGNSRDTELATEWVTHSSEVKSRAYQVAYVVHDSEAAIYRLLAGDENDPTRENPDQQTLIGSLESSVNGRVTLMNQALARLQRGDRVGARQSLRDADDLFGMNAQIGGIVKNENALLKLRQSEAQHQAFNGRMVLSITALAQLLLLAI